ncbi:MAG: HAD family hydrolase [Candidatus Hodarchaeota archaeon]
MIRFSRIKGIVFDLDGVIFNSEPLWELSVTKTIEHFYNVTPSPKFVRTIIARSNREILKMHIMKYHPHYLSLTEEIERTNQFLEEHFVTNMVPRIKLFPEVLSVIKFLKEKSILLGIATNAPKRIVSKILQDISNLNKYFDSVLTIDDVTKGKPNPEMLEKSLKELALSAEEVVFIGDSLDTDGTASKLAGIPFILIDREHSQTNEDINAISSLEELFSVLD